MDGVMCALFRERRIGWQLAGEDDVPVCVMIHECYDGSLALEGGTVAFVLCFYQDTN